MARQDFWMIDRMRVRFVEVDRQDIVQNGAYFTYFSVALNEYFRGLEYDRLAENGSAGTGFHVVRADIEYRAPLHFDELFDIGARVSRLGRSSFTLSFEIFRADSDDICAVGSQVWVNTDQTTRKSTPLLEGFRAAVLAKKRVMSRSPDDPHAVTVDFGATFRLQLTAQDRKVTFITKESDE